MRERFIGLAHLNHAAQLHLKPVHGNAGLDWPSPSAENVSRAMRMHRLPCPC
jgi:hypothetical protein